MNQSTDNDRPKDDDDPSEGSGPTPRPGADAVEGQDADADGTGSVTAAESGEGTLSSEKREGDDGGIGSPSKPNADDVSEDSEGAPVITGAMTPEAGDAEPDETTVSDGRRDTPRADDPYGAVVTGSTAAGAGAAEPQDVAAATGHHDDDYLEDHGSGSSSFAGAALRFLIIVLVVFGLSLWAVPMLAPHLPASIAQHIMPGQKALDDRLAQLDEQVRAQTDAALADVERMRKEIAALQTRVTEAEALTKSAQKDAEAARSAAAESAKAASNVTISEDVVAEAGKAATDAKGAAVTATTAATEAGKVAASATRDTASLARRMTAFEARVAALAEEMGAVGEALAKAGTSNADGEPARVTPEVTAALAQLQSKLEALNKRVGEDGDFLSVSDADRFATQDDLRSSRVALSTEIKESIAKLPEPGVIVTESELEKTTNELVARLSSLEERIAAAEKEAESATKTAEAANEASEKAEGKVEVAIRDASSRAAIAALTSRMDNGQPYATALTELEKLTGSSAPEELRAPADRGVATTEELRRTFGRRAQAAISATIRAEAEDDGVLGKASARFRSVLAGRPKNEREGEDTGAIISRIEARLREGELPGALEEAGSLPPPAKEALSDWLEDLAARVAADRAAATYIDTVARDQG